MIGLAERCAGLTTVNLSGCSNITDAAKEQLAKIASHVYDSDSITNAALGVDGAAGMPRVPSVVVLHGHTGNKARLMGFYERDGEANGFPRYKAHHQAWGKAQFLYRSSHGMWIVGTTDGIARNAGGIKSSTRGALVPLDLQWEVSTGGSWQADVALFALGGGPCGRALCGQG